MSQQQLDAQGEAREALGAAVSVYGPRVLNDPHILGNFVGDQIPDLPREQSLIVAGAEAGTAAEIAHHVQHEHIDPDTAVQLAARSLMDRKAIDPAASMWVAAEYARALGYPVRPAVPLPAPAPPPAAGPDLQRTVTTHVPYPAPSQSAPPDQHTPPPGPPWGYGPVTPAPRKRNKGLLYGGAAAAAAVVIAVVAVFVFLPGPKPAPTPPPTPRPSPTTASPKPKPVSGLASLTSLLPQDIDDPSTQCKAQTPPFNWTMPGLVRALTCTDPGLPGGYVYAYQVKTAADFQTAWASYNKWWGFDTTSAGSSCPPGNSPGDQGTTGWHDTYFPARDGQVLECEWVGSGSTPTAPAYTWTIPTENTFIVGQGADNTTFAALQTWWTQNSTPLASTTPAS